MPAAHTGTCSGVYGLVQLLTGAVAATVIPLGLTVLGTLALAMAALLVCATVTDRALFPCA